MNSSHARLISENALLRNVNTKKMTNKKVTIEVMTETEADAASFAGGQRRHKPRRPRPRRIDHELLFLEEEAAFYREHLLNVEWQLFLKQRRK